MKKFTTLAIANRGEVAVRIIHAAHELGLKTVLLHSEADVKTLAYRLADKRICIGASPTNESYLNIDRVIQGAKAGGAEAIHPGFGFLSENADFAKAVEASGMIFVGPNHESIRKAGDKISAKQLVEKARLPTVPGYSGDDQSIERLVKEAVAIGFPVIVKAAAGGGGRGMKVIRNTAEAPELIASAQREGQAAFGSPKVFLEKYLDRAKHIEIQIFGDFTGKVVALHERECSVQRRHQKIIEEALSPSLTTELRNSMANAAVKLAEAANYVGAGTVEFLLQDGQFYFLEMNTRLQVEHPVTEMVMGIDLVKAQILNSAHAFACWTADQLNPRGHSIECRIYAETSYASPGIPAGIPSTGKILFQDWPHGSHRRFEYGFEAGDEVTAYYDSMIAKVIVWDETRPRAIKKMQQTLRECRILGVYTNIPYLKKILEHPEFVSGTMTTQFIQKNFPEGLAERERTPLELRFQEQNSKIKSSPSAENAANVADPIQTLSWRGL